MPPCRSPSFARRQRGVAVVVAMLVVALAASTAIYLVWQQSLAIRQVENLAGRAQADLVARAAAEWAASILATDERTVDHLGEQWAQPLPAFPAENVSLAGRITDEQGRLNLNNLVRTGTASATDMVTFQRLLANLGLPGTLADALVDWLDPDDTVTRPGGAEDIDYLALDPPYRAANRRMADIGELAQVRGFTTEVVARLAPYVTALPVDTPVNVNTASAVVLQAIVPALTAKDAERLVDARRGAPFTTREDFLRRLPAVPAAPIDTLIDVRSRFFLADATVRTSRVATAYRALIDRGERGWPALASLTQRPW